MKQIAQSITKIQSVYEEKKDLRLESNLSKSNKVISSNNPNADRYAKFNELMHKDWQHQIEKLSDNLKLVKNKEKKAKHMLSHSH